MRRLTAVALLLAASGCKNGGAGSAGSKSAAEGSPVVARIGERTITVDEVEERLQRMDQFSRARYASPEQKKRFLDSLVRFEVMAAEAQSRGYDKDPDVQRVLKNQLIQVLVQREIDDKVKPESIPDAEVEKYYREHPEEFMRPEQVRVSQILVKDRAKADKLAADARGAAKDDRAFTALVEKHSEDEDSRVRGGDLTFFDRKTTQYPRPVVDAAFALREVGDVSAPVQSDKGFHVLKLTQRRPGFTRPLAEVKTDVRRMILRDLRAKKMDELVKEMQQKLKVQIYEDQLAKVTVSEAPAGTATGKPSAPPTPGAR